MASPITVQALVNAPMENVWERWTEPRHITQWAFASDDWEAPNATNNLRVGGTFMTRMSAKDKSVGFDFTGTYTDVQKYSSIAYVMEDGRSVTVNFVQTPEGVKVVEIFDPESENPAEMQRAGWQAILDNVKKYAESNR